MPVTAVHFVLFVKFLYFSLLLFLVTCTCNIVILLTLVLLTLGNINLHVQVHQDNIPKMDFFHNFLSTDHLTIYLISHFVEKNRCCLLSEKGKKIIQIIHCRMIVNYDQNMVLTIKDSS